MTSRICCLFGWLAVVALAPLPAQAQSACFVRLSPEANRMTIEHTKTVTVGGGSSTSVSASSGVDIGTG